MTDPSRAIWFFPSFASSYSYFAAQRIEDIAARHGRTVLWRPVLLRRLRAELHGGAEPETPVAILEYRMRDVARIAAAERIPLVMPMPFPPDSEATCPTLYALAAGDEFRLRTLTLALLQAIWASGRTARDAAEIGAALARYLMGRAEVELAARDPAGVAAHEAALAEARRSGMFGAPWTAVEGEAFWGQDRLDALDRWLASRPAAAGGDKAVAH